MKVNHYKHNKKYHQARFGFLDLFYSVFAIAIVGGIGLYVWEQWQQPQEDLVQTAEAQNIIDPTVPEPTNTPSPTPFASDNPQYEEIRQEIELVFGEHYEKAMIVLSCENADLDPEAVNTAGNEPAGSADVGVFQINDHWQRVGNHAFLKDYKINIRIAFNIYERDGESFKLWTCGRKYGV